MSATSSVRPAHPSLREAVRALPRDDKRILVALLVASLISLLLGVLYALVTVIARSGLIAVPLDIAHKAITLHATVAFYYWLYFAHAGVLLLILRVRTEGVDKFQWRGAFWAGFALMGAGFVLNQVATLRGAAVLYSADVPLSGDFANVAYVYVGYLLFTVGLVLLGLGALRTAIEPKRLARIREWSVTTFGIVMWWSLVIVSGVAALGTYGPALQWSLSGGGAVDFDYTMKWQEMFHIMHYLPIMATVILWYVLTEAVTGVKSIFSPILSKAVFSIYLLIIPPTALYHSFLSPGVSPALKAMAGVLGLLISVPTVLVFLIVVTSLEVSARAEGVRGVFGWLKELPWRNPTFVAVAMAAVAAVAGGALSNVLLQEGFAGRISDTFFVPAYFHFFTVGMVTLTLLGGFAYLLPPLVGARLRHARALVIIPYLLVAGVYLFGTAGVAAGYLGVPRRTFQLEYAVEVSPLWVPLMGLVGVGGIIMSAALLWYLAALCSTLVRRPLAEGTEGVLEDPLPTPRLVRPGDHPAWGALIATGILLIAMLALTYLTFRLMTRPPGGGG